MKTAVANGIALFLEISCDDPNNGLLAAVHETWHRGTADTDLRWPELAEEDSPLPKAVLRDAPLPCCKLSARYT